jgi:hypothetical protein
MKMEELSGHLYKLVPGGPSCIRSQLCFPLLASFLVNKLTYTSKDSLGSNIGRGINWKLMLFFF